MRTVAFLLALVAAAVLQFLGQRYVAFFVAIDLLLFVAVYNSLDAGPAGSLLGGSAAGLLQDALTGGAFGLHGFADTLVTWAVFQLRQRFTVQRPVEVGLVFTLVAALQLASIAFLGYAVLPGTELPGVEVMVVRMLSTGLLGGFAVAAVERTRKLSAERRQQRQQRLRLGVD